MTETLYEITKDLIILNNLDEVDSTNGQEGNDKLEQLQQALDNLNMKFIDKVCNIVKFVKNLEAHRDALAAEAKRLAERKRSFDSRIDWLKKYVKNAMEVTQSNKIKYAFFTIYVAPSQPSVEVRNIDEVEEEFLKVKKEVDKTKIMEQVKSTGVIPSGVEIVQGTHLVIR
ncbi:MAG: siphovirus Gp157 family protein [Ignavibacteriales bacterium]|nr:siphovirus Gp157 family protein [Ignavibacteriales bacterium]